MFKWEYECNFGVEIYAFEASRPECFYEIKFDKEIIHGHFYERRNKCLAKSTIGEKSMCVKGFIFKAKIVELLNFLTECIFNPPGLLEIYVILPRYVIVLYRQRH